MPRFEVVLDRVSVRSLTVVVEADHSDDAVAMAHSAAEAGRYLFLDQPETGIEYEIASCTEK